MLKEIPEPLVQVNTSESHSPAVAEIQTCSRIEGRDPDLAFAGQSVKNRLGRENDGRFIF